MSTGSWEPHPLELASPRIPVVKHPRIWALPAEPVTTARLLASGVSRAMIRTQLGSGRLLRLRPGVLIAAASWPPDPVAAALVRARAELCANPAAAMSHQSAALVWDLPSPGYTPWRQLPPAIVLPPGGGHGSQTRTACHHVALLPSGHLSSDDRGWPVTSLARTAVDLAVGRDLPEALVVLDAALRSLCAGYRPAIRRQDFRDPRLRQAAIDEVGQAALVTRRRLTAVLALADPARESPAESLSAGQFLLAGLPAPVVQRPLRIGGLTVFPDFYWEDARLVGECDGGGKYDSGTEWVREKEREQLLRDHGYRIVRWQAKEIMARPDVVIDRISRALERARTWPSQDLPW